MLILGMSLLIAVCLTAVQVALEYRTLRRGLDRQLDGVGIYVKSLEGSVWDFDEKQIQRVIDALVLVPGVALVEVRTAETGQRWRAGRAPEGEAVTRVYPLRHEHRGADREIGQVEIVASLGGIRSQVVGSAIAILISNALRIALVAVFMVFLIRRLLTSRLERMAAQVRQLLPRLVPAGPGAVGPELPVPVPPELDELDAVEWALHRTSEDLDRAVGALRESEARFRRIVETAHEGIWVIDAESRTTFVNRRMAEMLGYTPEEMQGTRLTDFMDEEMRAAAEAKVERRRQGIAEQHDFRFRRKDGTAVSVLIGTTPFLDEQGRYAGALGMITDVTERHRLEEQLRQSQKLEAVARLAAGVAHDFNNLLTAMLGDAELLVAGLHEGDPLREDALEIQTAAQRAALLTRQLLAFGRKQTAQPRVLDLNEVVGAMDRMLRRLIGEDIELRTVAAPGLGRVRADPGQVEQVIVNLAVNARDAMPGGGQLTIETANVEIPEAGLPSGAGGGRPGVLLAVSDTGCGMAPEVRAHLFEPFFTTKGPGKGTGLGLSTVYGIVKQCGGDIWVYSEPGKGSVFKVVLPRVDAEAEPAAVPGRPAAWRGTETILVVDDDKLVRGIAVRVLRGAGYAVLAASGVDEAMGILASAEGGPVRLLLTDVVLSRGSGPELATAVRAVRPDLAVLFVSGYTDRAVDLPAFGPRAAFVPKPFAAGELTRKVRELLDA